MQRTAYRASQPLILLALFTLLPMVAVAQKHGTSMPQPSPALHSHSGMAVKMDGAPATRTGLLAGYARLPLAFEPNFGQVDKRVRFLTHTGLGTFMLTDTEAVLTMPIRHLTAKAQVRRSLLNSKHLLGSDRPTPGRVAVLRMQLVGANTAPVAAGFEKLPGTINYFRGKDPNQWHSNIPTYRKAKFASIYRGVDVVYYGSKSGRLEYDFIVKPGGDPKLINLAFAGATRARVTASGELALQTSAGEVRWQRPVTYQVKKGHRQGVACAYELKHDRGQERVGFRLARYDLSRPVVIDPVLAYSTFLGGSGFLDEGTGIATDTSGSAYVTGSTYSPDFPVTLGAFQTTYGGDSNVFVTKLSADGSTLLYSTFLGGSGNQFNGDGGQAISVDSSGNAYVTGYTYSSDFPVTSGSVQTTLGSDNGNAFVTKLSANGSSLLYSTYLGGSGEETGAGNTGDVGYGIAVDSNGIAYVTGQTYSSDFPVTSAALQTTPGGAFVTKLNSEGNSLIYSTYLGGVATPNDFGSAIAVDGAGSAYVVGQTSSAEFPVTPAAYQMVLGGPGGNGYVAKLSANGSSLSYATYLGGSGVTADGDQCSGIAVDGAGSAYVTGFTGSADFPITAGAFQTTLGSANGNAFATKLSADGSSLVYSTYIGGSGGGPPYYAGDWGLSIAVDNTGSACITGFTGSADFPVQAGAFQTNLDSNGSNAFVTKLSPDGSSLNYSTFLGGSGALGDQGNGITVDSNGNVLVTGFTRSFDFPTSPGAFQTTYGGSQFGNAFATKLALGLCLISISPDNVNAGASALTVTLNGNGFAPGAAVLADGIAHRATYVSSNQLIVAVTQGDIVAARKVTVSVQNPDGLQSNSVAFNIGQPQVLFTGVTKLNRGSDDKIRVGALFTNVGTGMAINARLTAATLNGVETTTHLEPRGTIPAGDTANYLLTFPGTAGSSGQTVFLRVCGIDTGGRFSGAQLVTLP